MSRPFVIPAYAELWCLSNFSFLRGASHPRELVERAQQLGYQALAVTDECSLAGVVRAHEAARETGLKLLIGAQFEGLLTGGHWLDLARHANAMAGRLADALASLGIPLAWPCEANTVFPILSPALQQGLKAAGVGYLAWSDTALPVGVALKEGEVVGRFVTAFSTREADIESAIEAFRRAPC